MMRYLPLLLPLLAACEGSVNIDFAATPPQGVDAAVLRIESLTLLSDSESDRTIALADDFQIDTAQLAAGSVRALISGEELASGRYRGLRLNLAADSDTLDSYLREDGVETSLVLRAGALTQALSAFSIDDEETTSLTVVLDLRSSLLADADANGNRQLSPKLRLIEDADAGSIAGDVSSALLGEQGCDEDNDPTLGEVVYAFSGNVNADEFDGNEAEALSTALISREASSADYVLAFLPAGDYTVAVSCNAELDDPQRIDGVSFIASQRASVQAGRTTTLNFESQQ